MSEESRHAGPAGDGPPLPALGPALTRYELSGSSAALDEAFVAAGGAIAAVRGGRAGAPADAEEIERLMVRLPEFDRLVAAALAEAERSARAAAGQLWSRLGLRSEPPSWNEAERHGARMAIARACAPLDAGASERLRSQLLRMAAHRWAALLAAELCAADEEGWRRALGRRYESVRHRYAPRGRWRAGELAAVPASDRRLEAALRGRIERWMIEGGAFEALSGEIEAAFVHTRAPTTLA